MRRQDPPGAFGAAGSRPTLKQVAAVAGVSWKTVSRVVNDEPGVAAATRDLVQRVAGELGYRPPTPRPAASAGSTSAARRWAC